MISKVVCPFYPEPFTGVFPRTYMRCQSAFFKRVGSLDVKGEQLQIAHTCGILLSIALCYSLIYAFCKSSSGYGPGCIGPISS